MIAAEELILIKVVTFDSLSSYSQVSVSGQSAILLLIIRFLDWYFGDSFQFSRWLVGCIKIGGCNMRIHRFQKSIGRILV